jgi:hypothetical protein
LTTFSLVEVTFPLMKCVPRGRQRSLQLFATFQQTLTGFEFFVFLQRLGIASGLLQNLITVLVG